MIKGQRSRVNSNPFNDDVPINPYEMLRCYGGAR